MVAPGVARLWWPVLYPEGVMGSIIIGLIFIVGGLTGTLALVGHCARGRGRAHPRPRDLSGAQGADGAGAAAHVMARSGWVITGLRAPPAAAAPVLRRSIPL